MHFTVRWKRSTRTSCTCRICIFLILLREGGKREATLVQVGKVESRAY
ncbi:hypothetical protein PUN28_014398 [Cardiocondyla obscurior]|uniref:Uncharacterized protein n=1 Tax=Cardiocondyla obscurior TaxID=286306 RepID=A0AAW2F1J1_9HYME